MKRKAKSKANIIRLISGEELISTITFSAEPADPFVYLNNPMEIILDEDFFDDMADDDDIEEIEIEGNNYRKREYSPKLFLMPYMTHGDNESVVLMKNSIVAMTLPTKRASDLYSRLLAIYNEQEIENEILVDIEKLKNNGKLDKNKNKVLDKWMNDLGI